MTAAVTAGFLLIAGANLALVIACWKRRSVLGGIVGGAGIALVGYALAAGAGRGTNDGALLLIAALTLAIGCALYGLDRLLERLLEHVEPRQ